ncbi:hypothetical protein AQV86_03690 [Nanohaloarchaea archaeon SG9]|nr:hypothetical protein AQV86_03690 [Nanohaloarchaea archaeon SG9]
MAAETVTKSLLTVIGFLTGLMALLILRKLKNEDISMVKMRLKPESTIWDFRIISAANFLMFIGFLMYIAGVVFSNDSLWIISKAVGGIFGLMYAGVLFRWWRRF